MKTKQEIRKQILEIRKSLPLNNWKAISREIVRNVFQFKEFNKAKSVHTYVSSKDNEVDTLEFIIECQSQNKKVIVPIADIKTKLLSHSYLHSINDLQKNTIGILEPSTVELVDVDSIDVVIVPLIACDIHGNRIGYGAGFYDRFLKSFQHCKIGLAFEFQIVSEIPVEEHDIRLDYIVTEKQIIKCK